MTLRPLVFALALAAVPAPLAAQSPGSHPVPATPFTRDLISVAPEDLVAQGEGTGIYEGSPKYLADKEAYEAAFYETLASEKRYLGPERSEWQIVGIAQEPPPPCDQPQPTRYDADTCRYAGALFKELEASDPEEAARRRQAVRRGRDVWFKGTFGNQDLYSRYLPEVLMGEPPDYSAWLDTRNRDDRFAKFGLINDPDCRPGSEATYWLDECDDPHATGIVGLRKYYAPPGEGFDPRTSPYQEGEIAQHKRFVVGFSCAICHVAFDPTNPPADPDNPQWENLMGGIGNQYLRHGILLSQGKPKDGFFHLTLAAQRPGTVDTSLTASDFIFNLGTINAIMSTHRRPLFEQKMRHPITGEVKTGLTHFQLKGGEDSVGDRLALLRVYVNVGMCTLECWSPNFPEPGAIFGKASQSPFSVEQCSRDCEAWNHAEAKMDDLLAYLLTIGPTYLDKATDIDGTPGAAFIDDALVPEGRRVFIESCTRCHTTKDIPAFVDQNDKAMLADFFRGHVFGGPHAWEREFTAGELASPAFQELLDPAGRPLQFVEDRQDWLGNDRRTPVTELGVNRCRALHSNNLRGHIWEELSSESYHESEPVGSLPLTLNPLLPLVGGGELFGQRFEVDGGRGYLRNVSLLSVWSSAPLLHNNSVGPYRLGDDGVPDYSVKGRVAAFEEAMELLLTSDDPAVTPHREPLITVAPNDIAVPTRVDDKGFFHLTLPEGAPIGYMASVNPHRPLFSTCDDYVENKGHQFGIDLPAEEKQALIEFLKTL